MMTSLSENREIESTLSYYGWTVVGMCFLGSLVCFGFVYSFGVFLKPISSEFGWSRTVVSGAFSTYAILHDILAFFAGRAIDRYGPRPVLSIAGLSLGLSMFVMSRVSAVWELYLFFGVIFSIGVAATYVPVMTTVSWWFKAKRGLAIGLTAAGVGAGSLIFSPLSAWLISSFGWRHAYVILGLVAWILFIPVIAFIKKAPSGAGDVHPGSESVTGLTFLEAVRTKTFWNFCLSWLFIAMALFAIVIHLVPLATDRGMSIVAAGSLAGLIGGSSLIGRVGGGLLSDRFGRNRIYTSALIFQCISIIWFLFSREVWMLFVFAILFGIGLGTWTGVIAAFPADYFGLRAAGTILGFSIVMAGIGVAIGPSLGGYIFDRTKSYDYMIVMCILAALAAIALSFMIKPVKQKP